MPGPRRAPQSRRERCTATRCSIPSKSASQPSMRSPAISKARRRRRSSTFRSERSRATAHPLISSTISQRDGHAPLLEMRGIGKSFPGVRALNDVSLELRAGEVLALVGENGAGKSTLMKILSGAQRADEGSIFVDGVQAQIDSPRDAERLGIGMIYQEFTLVPQLDVAENISLGNEPSHGPLIDRHALRDKAKRALDELGLQLPLDVPADRLSIGQQQVVEIAKALARNARIIVMDEPTAALSDREIEGLFAIIARLKAAGTGIVYISHRMDELPRIADRIAVLRDGSIVETRDASAFPRDEIVRAMVGRTLTAYFPDVPALDANAPVVLGVDGLS